jgi:hypothetical protein
MITQRPQNESTLGLHPFGRYRGVAAQTCVPHGSDRVGAEYIREILPFKLHNLVKGILDRASEILLNIAQQDELRAGA